MSDPYPTNLPQDLHDAIEGLYPDADYAVYVLDGQSAELTGSGHDWHDALVLIDAHSMDTAVEKDAPLASPLVKLTRDPLGQITYHYPLIRGGELHSYRPKESTL